MTLCNFALTLALAQAASLTGVVDLDGNPADPLHADSKKATVLFFVRTDCPISNRYAPEIQRLQKKFSEQASFWLVYPDPSETPGAIQKHLDAYGYRCGAVRDPKHVLVKAAGATVSPEAALFAAAGKLVYHGRIDNRYISPGKARATASVHDLESAIEATLAGKAVAAAHTRATGCYLADVQ